MRRSLGSLLLLLLFTALSPTSASAACHFFTFNVTSVEINESAGKATVMVKRDAAVGPSSVEVSTVAGSAKGGEDFDEKTARVEFVNETELPFSVDIKNDNAHEPTEVFELKLAAGAGCSPNPNYAYGNNAKVNIKDDDASIAPPASPKPSKSPSPSPSPSASPSAAPTLVTAPSPSLSPSKEVSPDAAAQGRQDAGGKGKVLLLAGLAAAVLAGAGFALWRLRRPGTP